MRGLFDTLPVKLSVLSQYRSF